MIKKLTIVTFGLSLLVGCAQVKDELGLDRHSPDEFTVVKRAPLSLPPEYSLRPPRPGATNLSTTTEKAKTTVFGGKSEQNTATSPATSDQALLSKLGTSQANPEIRQVLDQESGYISVDDKSVAEKILFWQEKPGQENVINPHDEKQRLEEQKSQ